MVAIIIRIQCAVHFLTNGDLISKGRYEVFELCQTSDNFCVSVFLPVCYDLVHTSRDNMLSLLTEQFPYK